MGDFYTWNLSQLDLHVPKGLRHPVPRHLAQRQEFGTTRGQWVLRRSEGKKPWMEQRCVLDQSRTRCQVVSILNLASSLQRCLLSCPWPPPHTMNVRVSIRFSEYKLPMSSRAAVQMLRIYVRIEVYRPMPDGFSMKSKNFDSRIGSKLQQWFPKH